MIRGAVIHLLGDQPLLADLEATPASADVVLICRNLRRAGGKRPTFVDHADSTFVIPWQQIRFVEIPAGVSEEGALPPATEEGEEPLELDEDFLRRVREV